MSTSLSPRARSQLEIIQRAVDDVAQTVARMGEFYRLREPQLSLVPVDLNKLVRPGGRPHARALERHGAAARRRHRSAHRARAPILPPIAAVESQIRDALVNLVFNAVDAMPEGGPLTLRTALAAGSRSQIVLLEVEDNGIGMDEDTRRRCLEPFFTTKGTRGTGLGLAMVYGVAQRHGANLEIESEPGKGTLVRMSFAIAPAAVRGRERQPQPPPSAPLRILIVDDDPLLLKSLRDALETDGHEVISGQRRSGRHRRLRRIACRRQAVSRGHHRSRHAACRRPQGRRRRSRPARPATLVLMLTGWGRRLVAEGDVPPGVDQVLSKPPKLIELRAALAARATKRSQKFHGRRRFEPTFSDVGVSPQ